MSRSDSVQRTVRSGAKSASWALAGAGVGVAVGSLVAAGASAVAGYFARQVVVPVKVPVETLDILSVIQGPQGFEVILPMTEETLAPGVYSLQFDAGESMARIGEITSSSPQDQTVSRIVEKVYSGNLHTAVRGQWTGICYQHPQNYGFTAEDIELETELGPAPAWYVPATASKTSQRWAIMVHGRGPKKNEGIRALPVTHGLGMDTLLISYRNDGQAPAAVDGRYGLGSTEWRDVETAMQYAIEHGAEEIVLFGWSMGGAICLQANDLSKYSRYISAMVLDGPVIDWLHVIAHHGKAYKLPEPISGLGKWMMTHPAGRWVTGLASPMDFNTLNWVARADQLRTPTLIIHSLEDDFVPAEPAKALATKNPDFVTFLPYEEGGHTREWNVDPSRWELAARHWLADVFSSPKPPAARSVANLPAGSEYSV